MSIRVYRRREMEEPVFDFTPLVGMGLILLTFFAMRLNFTAEARVHSLKPSLATSGTAKERRPPAVRVTVTGAGTIHLSGRRIELNGLQPAASRLILESPGAPVLVVADETARAAVLSLVIDQLKLAGASDIGFSTRPEGMSHGDG